MPFDKLRVEFQSGVQDLRRHAYESHLRPKTFGGRPIERGAAFVALCEQCVRRSRPPAVCWQSKCFVWQLVTTRAGSQ